MEIIAILGGLILLAIVAFYVTRPLVAARRTAFSAGDTVTLEAQRDSLYTQIKELDLDHATGKVNAEDYDRLRADLVAQAAAVLKQLDGVTPQPAAQAVSPAPASDDVEALIASRRKTRSTTPAAAPAKAKSDDADVEAAIAARRRSSPVTPNAMTCPKCGKPINADDAFCAKCGAPLRTQATP